MGLASCPPPRSGLFTVKMVFLDQKDAHVLLWKHSNITATESLEGRHLENPAAHTGGGGVSLVFSPAVFMELLLFPAKTPVFRQPGAVCSPVPGDAAAPLPGGH